MAQKCKNMSNYDSTLVGYNIWATDRTSLFEGFKGAGVRGFSFFVAFKVLFLRAGSAVHFIYVFSLLITIVKNLAENLVKNLAKNLIKNLGGRHDFIGICISCPLSLRFETTSHIPKYPPNFPPP